MPDSLFELLFRHPRVAYESGDLAFAGLWPSWWIGAFVAVGVALVVVSYLRRDAHSWPLAAVRVAAILLVSFLLLRPVLLLSTALPQENVVAILIDDSRSMAIADAEGSSRGGAGTERGSAAREAFAEPGSSLLNDMNERFLVRHYRFAGGVERLGGPDQLGFGEGRTRIGPALDQVRRELASLPLAGIVVVTDGGDQASDELDDALLGLRSEGIPVHTVGMGRERLEPDLHIERVQAPASIVRGSRMEVEVVVAQDGLDGERVPVQIREGGVILATREVQLAGGGATVGIPLALEGTGVRTLRVGVPTRSGELVEENNFRDVQVRIREGPERILYFEGEPRHEVAFLRRALRDDASLAVSVLQRTADDRYLPLAFDDQDRLRDGFPRTRDELFRYRAIIVGSVEASYFTSDQLRMLAEFVDRRGGGLLALGGWRSLAEGGYAGTSLEPVLPVELSGVEPATSPEQRVVELNVRPTQRGLLHPVGRLGGETEDPAPGSPAEGGDPAGWESLPPLTSVNRLGTPRPGATVVLTGETADGASQPVFAHQRYGAGVGAILGVQDTWVWQMHADIPLEDLTHQRLWRQLLRWLVQDVSEPLTLSAVRDRVAPDEPVELVAELRDSSYMAVNDALVTAVVTDPVGTEREIPLAWSVERDGVYTGSFLPDEPGPHEVRVVAEQGADTLRSPAVHVEAGVADRELERPGLQAGLLRRIAEETGGRYHPFDRVASLPEALTYTERGRVVEEERDLWDLPLFFLLLVGLFSAEWLLRRRRGLA